MFNFKKSVNLQFNEDNPNWVITSEKLQKKIIELLTNAIDTIKEYYPVDRDKIQDVIDHFTEFDYEVRHYDEDEAVVIEAANFAVISTERNHLTFAIGHDDYEYYCRFDTDPRDQLSIFRIRNEELNIKKERDIVSPFNFQIIYSFSIMGFEPFSIKYGYAVIDKKSTLRYYKSVSEFVLGSSSLLMKFIDKKLILPMTGLALGGESSLLLIPHIDSLFKSLGYI